MTTIILLVSVPVFSQVTFRFGTQVGLTVTEPQKKSYSESGRKFETARPAIGLDCIIKFRKHFEISAGSKYETVGFTLKDDTYNRVDKLLYKKFCIPVKACLVLGKSQLKTILYTGVSPNYLLSGTYESTSFGSELNLFAQPIKPGRFTNQYSIGLGLESPHIAFNLAYNFGNQLKSGYSWDEKRYYQGVYIGTRHHEQFYTLDNDNFNLSVTYLFMFHKQVKKS